MQLKRDTDYAIRVLFCLEDNYEAGAEISKKGLTLSEIAAQAGIPKITAGRICKCLSEKGIIYLNPEQKNGEKTYFSTELLSKQSLLDVIEAMESTGRIFAVFDRKSAMYRSCEGQIQEIQGNIERMLAETSLESLMGTKRPQDASDLYEYS